MLISLVGWTYSTVVLCCLRQAESNKPFVTNRVGKIKQNNYIKCQYVPTKPNAADIGSRGSLILKLPNLCLEGSSWSTNRSEWPNQSVIQPLKRK